MKFKWNSGPQLLLMGLMTAGLGCGKTGGTGRVGKTWGPEQMNARKCPVNQWLTKSCVCGADPIPITALMCKKNQACETDAATDYCRDS